MSFTRKVKEEILNLQASDKSELSAIIKMSGSLSLASQTLSLSITTENAKIARHIYALTEAIYHTAPEVRYHQKTNLRKNRVYTVFLSQHVAEILSDLQLADSFFGHATGIEQHILDDDEAGRFYLRGVFLAAGTVRDPESGKYQLEIFSVYQDHAEDLANLLRKFMLDAKVIKRKNGAVTYLQKAEDIMDFFILVGAMKAKQAFEETKLLRETRNDLNRANNAEMANIAKTVTASMKTISNITKIKETIGFDALPSELRQVAQIRLEHPDYSLQEIADRLDTPLSKSGVNHRLRKINSIAADL
ncbi:DNA-binding protein WhiA [Streptococcus chenjunshii]|uniref:Probable cell division protein WhiA n=1 Tax=Streptococcus chenjunshii TaxID=2173853 RepID=A0A372KMX6_9STRE|nr:DNA-binding protein WhiA [Streptococcus chenjunshii]AXQ79008.1 DNA-binding protein WhiA [Streptococcus chenjunshii]RFU51435.1 DNA-binding protein WhiA [Streptococcus chenjunshii]RFU53635.1 DNA-binding protein WhiA [Streptococcus chenjunshii]